MASLIEQDTECPTVGKIEEEDGIRKLVRWRIPNALSLPSYLVSGVDSPEFTFANATWCLQMNPHGRRILERENSVDLQLVRRGSLVVKHEGMLRFGLNFAPGSKLGDISFEDGDMERFYIGPNSRCVSRKKIADYASVVSHEGFSPTDDCLEVRCWLLINKNVGDIKHPVGSATEDDQGFSIGDSDENPTAGVIEEYFWKITTWSIPSFPSVLRHARIQSPHFSFADATWCWSIRYCEEEATAKVAIVRLNTLKRGLCHELHIESDVYALSQQETETLKDAAFNSVTVERSHSEHEVFTFQCSQQRMESSDFDLTVDCYVCLRETGADDAESEPQLPGSTESVCKLAGDLKRLLMTSEDSNVTLLVRGQSFSAHSAILRARSSVLNSMLSCDMKERRTGTVDIEDCDPGTFADFLHFLYCGSVEDLSSENVFSLYRAADKYDVQDLKSQCVAFMRSNLTEDTFCETIALSLLHGERELLKVATEFFAKNFQRIILTVKWQEFITKNPIQGNEIFIKALVTDKKLKK